MDALLDFQEALLFAHGFDGKIRLRHLRQADVHLNKVRLYLRLAHQWRWLSMGQYAHISEMVDEVGRLLGGWIKQSQ